MRKTILIIATLLALPAFSQQSFDGVLKSVEENNYTLAAAKESVKANKLANKMGLTPSDPEVEFGYMWRNVEGGNKKAVNVRQGFDFPTLYAQRGKLANTKNDSEDVSYSVSRMNILLEAKTVCIELVKQNALLRLYENQLANAVEISQTIERMDKSGEANLLDKNKAQLNVATLLSEVEAIKLEKARLMKDLVRLNGGKEITFDVAQFEAVELPSDFAEWYAAAEAQNPNIQYLRSMVDVKEREVKVSKHEWLPKLSVGYSGEFLDAEKTQGVSVGVSIPLWQNKNRIKQAKAEALAAEYAKNDAELNLENSLQTLFERVKVLQTSAASIGKAIEMHNNEDLLYKAYNAGELSLLEYLLEVEYYISVKTKLLETQSEMTQAYAQLTAHTL